MDNIKRDINRKSSLSILQYYIVQQSVPQNLDIMVYIEQQSLK